MDDAGIQNRTVPISYLILLIAIHIQQLWFKRPEIFSGVELGFICARRPAIMHRVYHAWKGI